jgi:hypothetical protein
MVSFDQVPVLFNFAQNEVNSKNLENDFSDLSGFSALSNISSSGR